jgi:ketosteroid isomerase-like protein
MSLERMGARTAPDPAVRLQRAADAGNAHDFDAAISFYTPDAVFDMPTEGMSFPEGRAAIGAFWDEWAGIYEEVELELEEARDLGEGVTFAVFVQRGRLPSSTSRVEFRYASVTTWRDGLAERVTDYTDIDEARAAAERLAEERGARDRRRRRRAASSRVTAWLRAQRLPGVARAPLTGVPQMGDLSAATDAHALAER